MDGLFVLFFFLLGIAGEGHIKYIERACMNNRTFRSSTDNLQATVGLT